MKKEFSTNDHIHPDSGKDTHNQSSQENGTWNDHQLEQLFGEALGDTPTADETRKAWQTFIRRHRIRHQSIRRIMILGIAALSSPWHLYSSLYCNLSSRKWKSSLHWKFLRKLLFGKKGKG